MNELELRVQAIRFEAEGILGLELRRPDGGDLPAFEAGSHVDLELGAGRWRSYSLHNGPHERSRWCVAVRREEGGRGGSRHVHDVLRAGQLLRARGPRQAFPLDPGADPSVLIAGGIGITPLLAMVEALSRQGRPWALHYFARSMHQVAFRERLQALADASANGVLHLHVSDPPGRASLEDVVTSAPADAHLYCCGPQRMLSAFEGLCADRPADHVHLERFAAAAPPAVEGGFSVQLATSGRVLQVVPGRSILDTLLEAGLDVPHSCLAGICGSCELRVLAGVPDHRDEILSAAERAAGRTMMVCCSGAKSATLVLDL